MAHGLKYTGRFKRSGFVYKVELFKKDYVGAEIEIEHLGSDPVSIKTRSAGKTIDRTINGTELEFNFISTVADAGQFNDLYGGEWKDWRIYYYRDSTVIFEGWVKPENFVRDFIKEQYELTVSATDGLADLKGITFNDFTSNNPFIDRASVLTVVRRIFEHLESDLGFKIQLGIWETSEMVATDNAIEKATIDLLRFTKIKDGREIQDNCLTVLEEILKPFGVVIFQSEGYWWIQSKRERNSVVWEYSAAGAYVTKSTIDNSIDITNYDFRTGASMETLQPIKQQNLIFKDKDIGNSLIPNGDFSVSSGWTATNMTGSYVDQQYKAETTGTTGYFQSDLFAIANIPEDNGTITIQYKVKLESVNPSYQIPWVECDLLFGSTAQVPIGSNFQGLLVGGEYQLVEVTFPLRVTMGSNAVFKVRFSISSDNVPAPIDEATVWFDDVLSTTNFEVGGSRASDTEYKAINTGIVGSGVVENTLLVADSLQDDSHGAIEIAGVQSLKWNRYGKTDVKQIQNLFLLDRLTENNAYKTFVRATIIDINDVIKPYHRIKIDSTYYAITSYNKSPKYREIRVELVEHLVTDPTYDISYQILTSVDGESAAPVSGSSSSTSVIDDGVTTLSTAWSSTKIDADYEPIIGTKNSAFNKNFGTGPSNVAYGNHSHVLNALSDVSVASPSTNEVLAWSGSAWVAAASIQTFKDLTDTPSNYLGFADSIVSVNGAGDGLDFGASMNNIADVDITGAVNSDILYFNSPDWKNGNPLQAGLIDDASTSTTKLWSASKINSLLTGGGDRLTSQLFAGEVFSDLVITNGAVQSWAIRDLTPANIGAQIAGTYNTIIGTDADIAATTGTASVLNTLVMTDGVITSHSMRNMTLADLGGLTLNAINDVDITSASNGDILYFNSPEWINGNALESGIIDDASELLSLCWSGAKIASEIASSAGDVLVSKGILSAETGRNVHGNGLYHFNTNSASLGLPTPTAYWSTLGFGRGTSGSVELAIAWHTSTEMYFRHLRDTTDNWSEWVEVLHDENYSTYTVTKTGTGASGTWGIGITGNAATATWADQCDVNASDSGANNYSLVWHSGDTLYRSSQLYWNRDNEKLYTPHIQLYAAGKTTDIGSLNASWCHFNTTAGGFYFYDKIECASTIKGTSFSGVLNGTTGTISSYLRLNDNVELYFGTATSQSYIYSSGTHTYWRFTGGDLYIKDSSGNDDFWFDTPSGDFHAEGNITANSTSIASDRRLKKNIKPLNNKTSLEVILKGEEVSFNKKKNGEYASGFIAQNVEKYLPHLVTEGAVMGDETKIRKRLNYTGFIPYLSGAIKELNDKINKLEAQLNKQTK